MVLFHALARWFFPVAIFLKKMKGDPLKTLKTIRKKTRNENFQLCHSAEKVKGGPEKIKLRTPR